MDSLFSTRKPRNPSPQNRGRGLCFKHTGARYLTSRDVAARKPSAASEMDNQADTIFDSGGSTTIELNCATQLADRNYVHPVNQLGLRFAVASEQHLPQVPVCRGRLHSPLHVPRRTDTSLSGKNNSRAPISRRCFLELQRTLTATELSV